MSAALEVAAPVRPEQTGPRWLVSKRDDLVWFIGSAAVGYLALAPFALGFPPHPLVLFLLIGVCRAPHLRDCDPVALRSRRAREARRMDLGVPSAHVRGTALHPGGLPRALLGPRGDLAALPHRQAARRLRHVVAG